MRQTNNPFIMKKLPFLLIAACLLIIIHGCNVDEENEPIGIIGQSDAITDYISEDYALQIANQFAASYDAFAVGSRSSNRRASSRSNIVSSDSYSRAAASPFYIVNYDDGMGFMILSRKNIECPILAFIPEGTYSAAEYANHDGLNFFLACAEDYVNESDVLVNNNNVSRATVYKPQDIIKEKSVLPLIPVVWNQKGVFGNLCPNKTAGCIPIALAQIFTVLRPFNTLQLTYNSIPDLNDELDVEWDSLIRYYHASYRYLSLFEEESKDGPLKIYVDSISGTPYDYYRIGAMIREIGQRVEAQYHMADSLTTATWDNTIYALRYEFGLENTSDTMSLASNIDKLQTLIDAGRPVLMAGNVVLKDTNSPHNIEVTELYGHAWACDGYLTIRAGVKMIRQTMFHCNWGEQRSNGYFSKEAFNSNSASTSLRKVSFISISK